jgi:outer membrane lipoprotein SlyB
VVRGLVFQESESMHFLQRGATALTLGGLVLGLAACAPYPYHTSYPQPHPQSYPQTYPSQGYGQSGYYPTARDPQGTEYGYLSNIEMLRAPGHARTSGGGALLGAVVGGLLGNQFGSGSGRAAATAVGVFGGAIAGNAVEGQGAYAGSTVYRLTITLDHGGVRAYDVPSPGDLRPGERVRLYQGQISRM